MWLPSPFSGKAYFVPTIQCSDSTLLSGNEQEAIIGPLTGVTTTTSHFDFQPCIRLYLIWSVPLLFRQTISLLSWNDRFTFSKPVIFKNHVSIIEVVHIMICK
jgi:hypothetical protein